MTVPPISCPAPFNDFNFALFGAQGQGGGGGGDSGTPVVCPGTWTPTSACSSASCSAAGSQTAAFTSTAAAGTLCTTGTSTGATRTQQCYASNCSATATSTANFAYVVTGTSTACPPAVIAALVNATQQAVTQQPRVVNATASTVNCRPHRLAEGACLLQQAVELLDAPTKLGSRSPPRL